jgi:GT2 family glycosyltransferase
VAETVERLLNEGVSVDNLIVVDNSEEPSRRDELAASLPRGTELLFVQNRGYGAAVNSGLDHFSGRNQSAPEYFLVATHETKPQPGAVSELVSAMDDTSVAVAGPTLVSGQDPLFVWSAGGFLSKKLHVPTHYHHRSGLQVLDGADEPQDRQWLDGAFLLYRWNDIVHHRVDESFFLYMEETDLHLRILKTGRRVVWVPRSQVWQDSQGIPPYYLARNLRLLFKKHESNLHGLAVAPLIVLKRVVGDVVRRRKFSSVLPSIKGLIAPLGIDTVSTSRSLRVINPLGAALRHYESEILSILGENGHHFSSSRILEPSANGGSALRWLRDYIHALLVARKANKSEFLLVLWPVLGYLDIVIFRMLGIKRARLVMHDPRPLVNARGYSVAARLLASKFAGSTALVAHSPKAVTVLEDDVPQFPITLLPHPILEPMAGSNMSGSLMPRIRVLGQYKRDRDLDALRAVGLALGGSARLEILGRGWPLVEGWQVAEGFVPEDELVTMFAESDAVVIPYKNFYQSGIAIRALEAGVPFVGPRDSVLADVVGRDSRLLVSDGDPSLWTEAIKYAVTDEGKAEARIAAARWRELSISAWTSWVEQS